METAKHAIAASSPPPDAATEVESPLSAVLYDVSQQVQTGLEDLLKTINEVDMQSGEVTEEVEKCKYSAMERRKAIEEEKECFQKAAYAVLDMLFGEGKQERMLLQLDNDNHHHQF